MANLEEVTLAEATENQTLKIEDIDPRIPLPRVHYMVNMVTC